MNLRSELMPPDLGEARVQRLAELAAGLDGVPDHFPQADEWLDEFNRLAETELSHLDFQGISGATSHDVFVRNLLAEPLIHPVPDITRDELLELIRRLTNGKNGEHEQFFWIKLLEANVPDPRIFDLIYWPGDYFGDREQSRELTPEQILEIAHPAMS